MRTAGEGGATSWAAAPAALEISRSLGSAAGGAGTRALGFSRMSAGYTYPAIAPPTSGATQKSQSCSSAHPPSNKAGPVLRAGFTDVLVTGMLTR